MPHTDTRASGVITARVFSGEWERGPRLQVWRQPSPRFTCFFLNWASEALGLVHSTGSAQVKAARAGRNDVVRRGCACPAGEPAGGLSLRSPTSSNVGGSQGLTGNVRSRPRSEGVSPRRGGRGQVDVRPR
ncbi:hypothetical protein AGIG_G8811 [Arapaima gigas]